MNIEPTALLTGKHIISMKLSPTPGGGLQLKTVGGVMCQFEKLLVAAGKAAGLKTSVVVKTLTTDDDGGITITVLCLRTSKT